MDNEKEHDCSRSAVRFIGEDGDVRPEQKPILEVRGLKPEQQAVVDNVVTTQHEDVNVPFELLSVQHEDMTVEEKRKYRL